MSSGLCSLLSAQRAGPVMSVSSGHFVATSVQQVCLPLGPAPQEHGSLHGNSVCVRRELAFQLADQFRALGSGMALSVRPCHQPHYRAVHLRQRCAVGHCAHDQDWEG